MNLDPNRQNSLSVYGDGPFDDEIGHPAGCQDVAVIKIHRDFTLVRVNYLNVLEELVELQAKRIRALSLLLSDPVTTERKES